MADAGEETNKLTQHKNANNVRTKIQSLRNNKKAVKARMTKAKKHLNDIIGNQSRDTLPSKNAVCRAMNNVISEMEIIAKIINSVREVHATSVDRNTEEIDAVIEILDKELGEIGTSVDERIEAADKHRKDRLNAGNTETVVL